MSEDRWQRLVIVRKCCACGAEWSGRAWYREDLQELQEPLETTCDECIAKEAIALRKLERRLKEAELATSEAIELDLDNIPMSDELRDQIGEP